MPHQRKGSPAADARIAERAIVHQLLREDHCERWTRYELERQLADIDRTTVDHALHRLQRKGVLQLAGGARLQASDCARHLYALNVIGV
ncbi:MAG TPA: hypothetical protein VGL37_04970 [Solirubrobacteraceae bacterium]|jgi:hypothetical protein